jgi:hypothetical protein
MYKVAPMWRYHMAYYLYINYKSVYKMDRTKIKVLIDILMDSSLYETMTHDEKISLLSRLEKDYPALFNAKEHEDSDAR